MTVSKRTVVSQNEGIMQLFELPNFRNHSQFKMSYIGINAAFGTI